MIDLSEYDTDEIVRLMNRVPVGGSPVYRPIPKYLDGMPMLAWHNAIARLPAARRPLDVEASYKLAVVRNVELPEADRNSPFFGYLPFDTRLAVVTEVVRMINRMADRYAAGVET